MASLALVGAAHIHTPAYIDVLTRRTDAHVPLVWDHDDQRARQAGRQLGAATTTRLQDIWDNDTIDAVVICSETPMHGEHLIGAIRSGKAVFVEKPLTLTSQEAARIATEAVRTGTVFHTGYFLRYHPSVRFLRDAVRAGAFGQITRIHTSISHAGGIETWFDNEWAWMADSRQLGPDYFHDLGIHMVDLLQWMSGPIDRVIYDTGSAINRYPGLDEFGIGMLRFRQGHMGMIEASIVDWASPCSLTIHGTEGFASLTTDGLTVRGPVADRLSWTQQPPLWLSAGEGLTPFLDALAGQDVDLVTAEDASRTIAVMDAFTQSKRDGGWVHVPNLPH